MIISYRINDPISPKQFADLIQRSGLRRPVDSLDRLAQMLEHANLTITAWDGDKLVGISRSLTDFSYCCYLSDLAVDREYQRQGIGQELVRRTQETLGDEVMILLLASPEAMEYYPHIGFEKLNNAFHIPRKN
jgi:ribosomal protein S18 acetylase RimI-like enzyme